MRDGVRPENVSVTRLAGQRATADRCRRRRRRGEHGGATLLSMAAIALILLITAASAIVIGYVVAARRAGQAADLAAVSAAQTVEFGEPGCLIAERIAHNNGARIVTCDHVGDTIEFAITVVVEVDLGSGRLPGLPTTVPGRASAGRTENAT